MSAAAQEPSLHKSPRCTRALAAQERSEKMTLFWLFPLGTAKSQ